MLDVLIYNIYVEFGDVFQKTISIPMGTNSEPLLAELFFVLYEAGFTQRLLRITKKKHAKSFRFPFAL